MSAALLVWIALPAVLLLAACTRPPEPPRNLIFISLDTTRKDHLPTYGYGRDTAPALDDLARRGAVFTNAGTQWNMTVPAHATMFTGLYPKNHGVGSNVNFLPENLTTLAEVLSAAGLRTGAFVSGYPMRGAQQGLGQGFDVYDADFKGMRRNGRHTTDRALEWLRGLGEEEGFFLFLHYYDAHGPYQARGRYRELFRSSKRGPRLEVADIPRHQRLKGEDGKVLRHLNDYLDRYDGLIRYQDDLMAEVLAAVDLERTAVVVTADHGETLGERPIVLNHGGDLYEEQVAIPLVLFGPGVPAGRHDPLVETVDLMPTLIELMGVEAPVDLVVQGESLLPILDGTAGKPGEEFAFASSRSWAKQHAKHGRQLKDDERIHSVRAAQWKLILYPGVDQDVVELYDLKRDPGETIDVAEQYPEIRDRLLQALGVWKSGETAEAEAMELTPEARKKLEALGYLGN